MSMQKLEKKIMLALMCYVLKIKYHIVFNILLLSNTKNSHYVFYYNQLIITIMVQKLQTIHIILFAVMTTN